MVVFVPAVGLFAMYTVAAFVTVIALVGANVGVLNELPLLKDTTPAAAVIVPALKLPEVSWADRVSSACSASSVLAS